MANADGLKMTIGAKAATSGTLKATLNVEVHVSRWFIWTLKLRYIWAVIRADIRYGDDEG